MNFLTKKDRCLGITLKMLFAGYSWSNALHSWFNSLQVTVVTVGYCRGGKQGQFEIIHKFNLLWLIYQFIMIPQRNVSAHFSKIYFENTNSQKLNRAINFLIHAINYIAWIYSSFMLNRLKNCLAVKDSTAEFITPDKCLRFVFKYSKFVNAEYFSCSVLYYKDATKTFRMYFKI